MRLILLTGWGIVAGGLIAIQSVLNATSGQRVGNLGSVLAWTIISSVTLIILILFFPSSSSLSNLPGISKWYLYIGGVLEVAILATPIYLVPRIGTTSTLIAIVLGQLAVALVIDQFELFASPKIGINFVRVLGILLVALGAYLVGR